MLNLVLFGPPGAGKGTQSEYLINKYNLTHISTGDLFRKHLGEGTELGKTAQKFLDVGNLVPDDIVIGMVDEKINSTSNTNGFIFDGFPRTIAQAKALDALMQKNNTHINTMLALEVSEDELMKRLQNRGKTSGRVDDQNEAKIKNRIQVYNNETTPVAEYYKAQGKLNSVKGVGTIEEIFNRLSKLVDTHI